MLYRGISTDTGRDFLKGIALLRCYLPIKYFKENFGFIVVFFPKQFVKNRGKLKNAVSSTTYHKLFAFLSAIMERSGTCTITTDMIVLCSLFTQHHAKDQCKQALQYAG